MFLLCRVIPTRLIIKGHGAPLSKIHDTSSCTCSFYIHKKCLNVARGVGVMTRILRRWLPPATAHCRNPNVGIHRFKTSWAVARVRPSMSLAIDLAQCAGMELDEYGNLQPCKPIEGEVESAVDPKDMPDLRPVGLRFLVRAGTMHCPCTAHACCARSPAQTDRARCCHSGRRRRVSS